MTKTKKSRRAGGRFNETSNGVFWLIVEERQFSVKYEIYPCRSLHSEKDLEDAKREIEAEFSHPSKKVIFITTWTILLRGNII